MESGDTTSITVLQAKTADESGRHTTGSDASASALEMRTASQERTMAKTILVVDDSSSMVMSLKATLTMNGFQVETAADGKLALDKLKAGIKPDLIQTDINMPNMGGLELIKNIRALPNFRFVPVLTLTTESDPAKREEAKRSGATGWLVKPVDGNELIKVLKRVLPG
jgi:two-component system chemotaxis response regulator CheY